MISTGRDSRALLWISRLRSLSIQGFAIVAPFSITLIQVTQILADLSWLATARKTRDAGPTRLPLLGPMAIFLAASFASALLGIDPERSLWGLKSAWLPVVFFLACVNTLTAVTAQRTVRFLVTAGAVAALGGLSQTVARGVGYRIAGTFGHYMTFSGVILIISLLTAAQLLFNRHVHKFWSGAALAVLLGSLLMTQTRSAWLGLAAGAIPLVWSWRKRYLLALPLIAIVVVALSPQPVQQRVLSYVDLEDITLQERLYMWSSGWSIIREYPLLGVGPENLEQVYATFKHPDDPRLRFTHLHNNLVQTAAERGSIALVAWLLIWIAYFWAAARIFATLRGRDGPERALLLGSVAAIVAFLVAGIFECNYRDSEVRSLIYLVMALPFCIQPLAIKRSDTDGGD